ncbi:MAG TPA: EamA family transporter [Bacillus bacterium]|nr:EamA family transporter [Bacillus sp. (in: firmicutes)]
MEEEQKMKGFLYGFFAYLIWGVLPLYWKALDGIPAEEILAHRVFWSFILMVFIIVFFKKWDSFLEELKIMISNKLLLLSVVLSGVLISGNWLIYIWAVNHDHVLEASLGYYINPLISVLLGIIVLENAFYRLFVYLARINNLFFIKCETNSNLLV